MLGRDRTKQEQKSSSTQPAFSEFIAKVKSAFSKFRAEMSDHLEAINTNTSEIQLNSDYLGELDVKVEKVNERLDEVFLQLNTIQKIMERDALRDKNFSLTKPEQKVFLVLYTLEQTALSYADIAQRLNWTELQVKQRLDDLIKKGVPINKLTIDNRMFFRLEDTFKQEQMKKSIVQIDSDINRAFF